MTCQEAIDVMGDALEGRLDSALRPGFEEHLAECSPCGTYFGQLSVTREALGLLARPGGTSPRRVQLIEEFQKEFDRGGD
jgi:predicted anti-sigma-YlaC factor YlaD